MQEFQHSHPFQVRVPATGPVRTRIASDAHGDLQSAADNSPSALSPGPTFNAEVILGSLLVLLLAYVWSYGLDLERERALTI